MLTKTADMKQGRWEGTGLVAVALVLMVGVASAGEHAHGSVAHRVITIDGALIRPPALTVNTNDVLEFVNYSPASMMLVFIEPQDQPNKIRCRLAGLRAAGADKMASQLFSWGPGQRLTEVIPAGRFVSVCSLAPGQYVFVTKRVGMDPQATAEELGTKGTITVR